MEKSIIRSVFNRSELIKAICFRQLFGSMRMFVCENSDVNARGPRTVRRELPTYDPTYGPTPHRRTPDVRPDVRTDIIS